MVTSAPPSWSYLVGGRSALLQQEHGSSSSTTGAHTQHWACWVLPPLTWVLLPPPPAAAGGATALEGQAKGDAPPSPGPSSAGIRLAGATNDVHIMDVRSGKWEKVTPQGEPPSPRAAHAAAAVGNMVVVQGGIGPAGLASEDLHVLDFTDLEKPRWHRCGAKRGQGRAAWLGQCAACGMQHSSRGGLDGWQHGQVRLARRQRSRAPCGQAASQHRWP